MIHIISATVHRATRRLARPPTTARISASASSCPTRRARPAPIERRTAISPERAAPRARSRLAMFAHAISSTKPVTPSSIVSGVLASLLTDVCPRAPPTAVTCLCLNRAMVWSLIPFWSGASTSLMMARYGPLIAVRALSILDSRLQAREQVGPVGAAVVEPAAEARRHQRAHRDRHEHQGPRPERRAVEPLGRHADDRHGLAVDDERLVEDVGAAVEIAAPVGVAQHHHVRLTNHRVVAGSQEPAERRLDAEHREVAAGHEDARPVDGPPASRRDWPRTGRAPRSR